jgi:hypothetical protein
MDKFIVNNIYEKVDFKLICFRNENQNAILVVFVCEVFWMWLVMGCNVFNF